MAKFKKRPVVIDAFQLNSAKPHEVTNFLAEVFAERKVPLIETKAVILKGDKWYIETLEGVMQGDDGDYLIVGVANEVYPCKPDIFLKTHEPAE